MPNMSMCEHYTVERVDSSRLRPLTPEEDECFRRFNARSRGRFRKVYRGTHVIRGLTPHGQNVQIEPIDYSKLYFYGEKAKQAISNYKTPLRIKLGSPTEEDIRPLINELNALMPSVNNVLDQAHEYRQLDELLIAGRFKKWTTLRQTQFRNLLVYMLHKLGNDVPNSVYPETVLVSTSWKQSVAIQFGNGGEQVEDQRDFKVLEYWLPRDHGRTAVSARDLKRFQGILPSKWVWEEEAEVAVIGALFPNSIIRVHEYAAGFRIRSVVNPHLISHLNIDPTYKLPDHAGVDFDQTGFEERLSTETSFGVSYLRYSNECVINRVVR